MTDFNKFNNIQTMSNQDMNSMHEQLSSLSHQINNQQLMLGNNFNNPQNPIVSITQDLNNDIFNADENIDYLSNINNTNINPHIIQPEKSNIKNKIKTATIDILSIFIIYIILSSNIIKDIISKLIISIVPIGFNVSFIGLITYGLMLAFLSVILKHFLNKYMNTV